MSKIKLIWSLIAILMMSCGITSCDKDDIDEFTSSVVDTSWVSEDGEVYEFYSSFKGVIYADGSDFTSKKIDMSFVWTETDDILTIGIDAYREDNGEMVYLSGEDMITTSYHIDSYSAKKLVLSNGSKVMTLTAR
ncbi:MAG: hypothetical protein NC095_08465 [Muribaculum sp.]|nr:hypothetical protein [Muribaculum sp.]